MKVTTSQLRAVMRSLREIGYSCLTDEEKAVCDAFDAGKMRVIDDEPEPAGAKRCGFYRPDAPHVTRPSDY